MPQRCTNPATLKAYLYDNNNTQRFQDGSGNDPALIGTVVASTGGNPIGIAVGIIIGIATFFGLFGGGAHAPGPPPQVQPHDPGLYRPSGASSFGELDLDVIFLPPAPKSFDEFVNVLIMAIAPGGAEEGIAYEVIGRVVARHLGSASPVANEIGMLRAAASGKGNFGLGAATAEDAARLGSAWVGPGARASSSGKAMLSADGLRQFRPPSFKPSLNKMQANFEQRWSRLGKWQSNGHLDIFP